MNTQNINYSQDITNDHPKISFLEAFYGILFLPNKTFQDLYNEEGFTIAVYGVLAIFLSNLGKIGAGSVNILSIIGTEIIGFVSWFFVGLFIIFFSTVFKTPNNNLARLLGFTGLASIPYLLLAPISLLSDVLPGLYTFFEIIIGLWGFILFWMALAKSFQLESWRVFLMAIIPFLLGIFLFTFLLANIFGFFLSGLFMKPM